MELQDILSSTKTNERFKSGDSLESNSITCQSCFYSPLLCSFEFIR